ncbi:MAG TPA: hypothetical protein VN114_09460 [Oxalicibacterium sp.]|uniref:hypothetical protein n=1 Tax=Oxalicibacterium sp. TaxID=2766525 RepID=UPI002BBB01FA|nr:hypothetical protein [Oxalicibacterium sp.]HWU98728.1 hypothetical protein [Oxalicibacterium sp.]
MILLSLSMTLFSCFWISCWYADANARTIDQAQLPEIVRRHGKRIAMMGAIAQLVLSAMLIGTATGPLLVAVAWMTMGNLFVLCINAWPKQVSRWGFALGIVGAIGLMFA